MAAIICFLSVVRDSSGALSGSGRSLSLSMSTKDPSSACSAFVWVSVCCASEVVRSTSFKRGEGLSRLNCARTTKHITPADANTRLRRALDIARNFVSSNLNAFLMGIASIAILMRTNLLIFLASRPISAGGLRLLRRDLTAKACIKRRLEVPYLGEHNLADSSIPNESIIPILESIESIAVPTPSACCTARLPPSHRIQFNDSGLRLRLFPRLERLPILTNAFQQMTKRRPREITVAAVVVFIGSSLFLFAGLLIAASVEVMLLAIRQKYPGVNFHNPNSDLPLLKQVIGLAVAIPIALGVTGILSGRGLLRMRSWARNSTIFWSVGSSLLCLVGLAYPGSRSGIQFSA